MLSYSIALVIVYDEPYFEQHHFNVNTLRNKFEQLKGMISGTVDILIITETELDDTFPSCPVYICRFSKMYRLDHSGNGGDIMIYRLDHSGNGGDMIYWLDHSGNGGDIMIYRLDHSGNGGDMIYRLDHSGNGGDIKIYERRYSV